MRTKQYVDNQSMIGRPMTLGKKIKELRKLKHWRQIDVANKTGLKRSHIARIERDDYNNWEVETIKRLALGFEIHPHVLLAASGLFDGLFDDPQAKVSFSTLSDEPALHIFFSTDWPEMTKSEREIVQIVIRAAKEAKDKRLGKNL